MKSNFYLLLAMLWLLAFGVRAQAPTVRISVNLLPPYSTHLADYVDQPGRMQVTVTNLRTTPANVQFAATLSSDAGVRAFTKPGYQSGRPFSLDGLQTRMLDQDELKDLFEASSLAYEGANVADIVRGGGLPEGTYTICVQALDYATRQPLSGDAPVGCSRPVRLGSLEAPYLLRPVPDEVVRVNGPQNIIFTWTRPAGAPPTTEYEFRLVEMSSNMRSPNDAFLAATVPALYERTLTGAPVLLYGPAEPALVLGRRYAFAVRAIDPTGNTLFRNGGRSEVQAFTYGTVPAVVLIPPVVVPPPVKTPPVAPPPYFSTAITGRLQWGWRASEETNAPLTGNVGKTASVSGLALEALRDPTAGLAAANALRQALGKFASLNEYQVVGLKEKPLEATDLSTTAGLNTLLDNQTVVSGGGTSVASVSPALGSSGNGLQMPTALGSARFPMANVNVRLIYRWGYAYGTRTPIDEVVGRGTTDENGNFAILIGNARESYENADFSKAVVSPELFMFRQASKLKVTQLRLEVDDMHFHSEPGIYPLTRVGDNIYTVGETLCMAKSYRLVPKVVNSQGQPVTGVKVQVGRMPAWYGAAPYARAEGMLPAAGRPDMLANPTAGPVTQQNGPAPANAPGAVLATVVAEAALSDTPQPLTRLLANVGGANDQYWVRISGGGRNPLTTTLSVWPGDATGFDAGVVSVNTTYVLPDPPLQVRGRVRTRPGGAPVANATVVLWPTGTSKQAKTYSGTGTTVNGKLVTTSTSAFVAVTTQTDANGYFNVDLANSTLKTRAVGTPLTLEVTGGPGLPVWREDNIALTATGPGLSRDTIWLDQTTFPVAGLVREAGTTTGVGLRQATLRWASGGGTFQTDDFGRFLTTHMAGTDTIIISKEGYRLRRVGVSVGGTGSTTTTAVALPELFTSLNARLQPAGAPAYELPGTFQPLNDANALGASLRKMTAWNTPFGQAVDMGTLDLVPLTGDLRVVVTAGPGGPPVAGAVVALAGAAPARSQTTDAAGQTTFLNLNEGTHSLVVSGPVGTSFALGFRDVWVLNGGPATTARVALLAGGTVRGVVKRGTQALAGATVVVAGRPDWSTTTGPDGRYELPGLPAGAWVVEATGPGAAGQTRLATVAAGSGPFVLDFALVAFAGNLAPTALLGFPIELTSLRIGADTVVSGYFVNMRGNATFRFEDNPRLGFTNVAVRLGPNGNLRPKGRNYVVTDVTELKMQAFGYLPVRLRDPAGLRVAPAGTDATQGQLLGTPEVTLSTFASGLNWDANTILALGVAAGPGLPPPVAVITAMGTLATPPLRLRAATATVHCTNLCGFAADINPALSTAGPGGLYLAGTVDCNFIAGSVPKLPLSELWLDVQGNARRVLLKLSASPTEVQANGFRFALKNGTLNEAGFTLSGGLVVQPTDSNPTTLDFNGLRVSRSPAGVVSTYGGSFAMPTAGMDVFKTVFIKPVADKPLVFGQVTDKPGVFCVSGAAGMELPKIEGKLPIQWFEVRSDRSFDATIKADLAPKKILGGLATLSMTAIKFKTVGGADIYVQGGVQLVLPMVQAAVSGIHYRPGPSVPIVTVDSVGLTVPIPVGEIKGYVHYKEVNQTLNGQTGVKTSLGGALAMNITSFVKLGVAFNYINSTAGNYQEYSADVLAGLPPVLIGPGIALQGVGGGVAYNTKEGVKRVSLSGVVAMGGYNGVALNPIVLDVLPGIGAPSFRGTATLTMVSKKVGNVNLTINVPKSLISATINTAIEAVPGVGPLAGSAQLTLSGQSSDTYWFLGAYAKANLGGLFNGYAVMAVGWELDRIKHWNELAQYTAGIDESYLSNGKVINGAHLSIAASFGRKPENPTSVNIGIGTAKLYYGADGYLNLNANFVTQHYGMAMGCAWYGGMDISVAGKSIIGGDVLIRGDLSGSYAPGAGWVLDGSVGGKFSGRVNCGSAGECSTGICWWHGTIPQGFQACVNGSVGVHAQGSNVSVNFKH